MSSRLLALSAARFEPLANVRPSCVDRATIVAVEKTAGFMERQREKLIVPLRRRQPEWEPPAFFPNAGLADGIRLRTEDRKRATASATAVAFVVRGIHRLPWLQVKI